MQQEILNAVVILCIGMTTVFVILFLIVVAGSALVRIVNRFADRRPSNEPDDSHMDSNRIAIITSVVHRVTQGKGRVQHIEKL